MNYAYVAYTKDKKMVKGQLEAGSEEAATNLLGYGGYQVLTLKEIVPFFDPQQMFARFSRVKPMEMVMFSRQLALLLESGTDIVTSLELLQSQVTNQTLKKVISHVTSDIRGGSSLSGAMRKEDKGRPDVSPHCSCHRRCCGRPPGLLCITQLYRPLPRYGLRPAPVAQHAYRR